MDLTSRIRTRLRSTLDTFVERLVLDVAEEFENVRNEVIEKFKKEYEVSVITLEENRKKEVQALMDENDALKKNWKAEKEKWAIEKKELLDSLNNALNREQGEGSKGRDEQSNLFDPLTYFKNGVNKFLNELLKPELDKGKVSEQNFIKMVDGLEREIVNRTLEMFPVDQYLNTSEKIDEHLSASKRRIITRAYEQLDRYIAASAIMRTREH